MKLRFLILAQRELDDAVAWYNEQAAGLGQEFLDELDRVVRRAVTFPMSCPEIEPGVRRCLLARFPYGLIYGVDGGNARRSCRGAPASRASLLGRSHLIAEPHGGRGLNLRGQGVRRDI